MFSNWFVTLTALFILGCAGKATVVEDPITGDTIVVRDTAKEENPHTGHCYLAVIGKDSILLNLSVNNNMVTGYLHYRFSEKDKSGGKFIGTIKGDTIFADYQFMAEGMESEREVAFLRNGEELVEGYGDSEERNGRMVFKDHGAIKFDGKPLKHIHCDSLAWYFSK